ncbi:basic amino acid ABC transporter substrate-binding protein [Sutterella sp.]|uniref:basic amino acid ABC transporter substrate-binding protein n=1 Tax=Sutterella sp. TaxID=1981025 RepID=UPI0026E00CDA|nr:basic amino acid ABC transporter substrate-binding protein [Sutterella sp.]MDO5531797.1 basic amino acid ABC transporter substrate-binding protein [Sutterella sp.]
MKLGTFTRRTALAAAAAFMLCGSASAADTWRVATEGTFPPFEFYNSQTGEIQGFEVDLVRAMAKKMGKELHLETMSFDAIIPAILSGTIDTGAAGFSVTPERAKRVLFSTPFYKSGLTIVVPNANKAGIKDFKDLEGKRISVQLGTTSMTYAKEIKGAKVTTFNSAGDALLNVLAGNGDAIINDKPVTDYMLAQNKSLASQCTHLKPIATADLFAMVMAKGNDKLKAEIDKALKDLKADGTFNELHKKWFGVDADPELP